MMKKESNIDDASDVLQRPFRLAHQTLAITAINFETETLVGYVELLIYPLRPDLRHIKLNCKQCKIFRVCINNLWEVDYLYNDPTLAICHEDTNLLRSLQYFTRAHTKAVKSVDADAADGELTINLPSEISTAIAELRPVKLLIEYSLEHPKSGVQFVNPDISGTLSEKSAHLFTFGSYNASRLWFPCVDGYSEVCTWKLEFTVDLDLVAVSCGDLVEVTYSEDMRSKVYHYYMSSPIAAPNIALAVGPFETLVDPNMHEVTHFCLPGLMPILKHTTSTLHQAFEFYEELMSSRYPYSCYKQVFVDQAYQDASPYATMSIFSTNILHSVRAIDQTPISRKLMASAIAHQFFGCFIAQASWYDAWLIEGMAGFLTTLFIKKFFGNNEYRYFIMKEMKEVCDYEQKIGGIVLNPRRSESRLHFPVTHPHLMSSQYLQVFCKKAHLVMRILEIHIGLEHLLQGMNKLLSLAYNASQQGFMFETWSNMLLSHSLFLKVMGTVTGKDIKPFFRQWVTQGGCARFSGSFVFIRKRNVVELEIKQDQNVKGAVKYAGPITVILQELDGSFKHIFNIEENKTKFEITCHSKSRRNKKKKIPLITGEEVDMDLTSMDQDSPVLWLRLDPDMVLLRDIFLEQTDYMWQYQLKYERDIVAQSDAITALDTYPTAATRVTLTETLENEQCFYRVRMDACQCLTKVANSLVAQLAGPPVMMTLFRKMFGSHSCPSIIRQNNFSNFQQYFLLKTIPVMMAQLRTSQNICPTDVFRFLLDLSKYNDNSKNKYSDGYYRASLIDAFATTITPAVTMVAVTSESADIESLSSDTRLVLEEITRYLNLEKLLPSYRHTVTISCLKAVRTMQRFGHLPSDSTVFRSYAQPGVFQDVRIAALEVIVDLTKTEKRADELDWILDFAVNEKDPFVRHRAYVLLSSNPPFTKNDHTHPLNTPELVEKIWLIINTKLSHDHRLRCDLIDVYYTLYGNVKPHCILVSQLYKPKLLTPEIKSVSHNPQTAEVTSPVKQHSLFTFQPVPQTQLSSAQQVLSKPTSQLTSPPCAQTSVQTLVDPILASEDKSLKRKASEMLVAVKPNLESSSHVDLSLQPVKSEESGSFKLKIKIGSSDTSQENSPMSVTMETKASKGEPSVTPLAKGESIKLESRPIMRVSSWTEGTSHLSEEDSSSTVNSPVTSPARTTTEEAAPTATVSQSSTVSKPPIKLSFEGLFPKRQSSSDSLTLSLSADSFRHEKGDESSGSPQRSKKKKKKEKHKHKHKHKHRHDHHRHREDRQEH